MEIGKWKLAGLAIEFARTLGCEVEAKFDGGWRIDSIGFAS
jgi:hypothetical protein